MSAPKTEAAGTAYKKGDFIGKPYEVLGVLGVGGFSVVYLVHSHETGTAFALKTLRDQVLQDTETASQFKRNGTEATDPTDVPILPCASPRADPVYCLPSDVTITDPLILPDPTKIVLPSPVVIVLPPWYEPALWYWGGS